MLGVPIREMDDGTYLTGLPFPGQRLDLGRHARSLPEVAVIQLRPLLPPGRLRVRVVSPDGGEVLASEECDCMNFDCEASLGCAITCVLFPINLLCPRCLVCA